MITANSRKISAWTLLLQTIISMALTVSFQGVSFAADKPTSAASESFNVGKILTTKDQSQTYLKSGNPIGSFIVQIVNFLVLMIGSFSFLALVIGGFTFMTSHGSENQLTKGKDIIKYSLIGLAVSLSAFYIAAFVQNIFYELPAK